MKVLGFFSFFYPLGLEREKSIVIYNCLEYKILLKPKHRRLNIMVK